MKLVWPMAFCHVLSRLPIFATFVHVAFKCSSLNWHYHDFHFSLHFGCKLGALYWSELSKGSGQNYYTRTGPTKPQNRWFSLPAPPLLKLKRWCLYCIATPLSSSKKWQWDSENSLFLFIEPCWLLLAEYFCVNSNFKANKIWSVVFMSQVVSSITPLPQTRWVLFDQSCYDQFPN